MDTVNPTTNALVLLNNAPGSFGLAIIIFTILMRVATFPLTLRQLRSSVRCPRCRSIAGDQKKHKTRDDGRKRR
jgi:membrane protein insertase Oxa1/YidC/SpoIIIJ